MNALKLKIGDMIQHIKRGSSYEVFARTVMQDDGCSDGEKMFFILRNDPDENNAYHYIGDTKPTDRRVAMWIPLLAQKSNEGSCSGKWIIYRSFGGELHGDSMFFARPESEFTYDRFIHVGGVV